MRCCCTLCITLSSAMLHLYVTGLTPHARMHHVRVIGFVHACVKP